MNKKHFTQGGFSVAEMLIFISILIILSIVTIQSFSYLRTGISLSEGTGLVSGTLEEARSKTISSENRQQHGVRLESSQVTLFEGGSYSSTSPSNDVRLFPRGVYIDSFSIGGSGDVVVFERLTGETKNYGSIFIGSVGSTTMLHTVSVDRTGIIYVTE